jgi:hypothetical protein
MGAPEQDLYGIESCYNSIQRAVGTILIYLKKFRCRGKHVHMIRNCWGNHGNKGKRPDGWKSNKGESVNVAVDGSHSGDFETMLFHLDLHYIDDMSLQLGSKYDTLEVAGAY